MALIRCPECGREVSDRAVACPNCGMPVAEMIVKPQYCHSCGAPLTKGALFCTECGTKVAPAHNTPLPQTPHKTTAPMPPTPPKPRETPKGEKAASHTPHTPPLHPTAPAAPVTPAAPTTETPVTTPEEKVEIPQAIKPKSAPSLGLSEKAGKRRAEALARKETQSNDGRHISEKQIPAPETPGHTAETPIPSQSKEHTDEKPADNADMPAMVTPKAAPSIPTAKNNAGKPAHHNIRKTAEKPQPPVKTVPAPEQTPKPSPNPTAGSTVQTTKAGTNMEKDTVDDSQFYEAYDDNYQPFEQQLAQNKEKQKKNIIMASVLIFTIAVVCICIWIFASVDDNPTVTEVVEESLTETPAPQWLQGEWHCQGSAFIDGKQTMVNSSMTINGDSVTISDYMGKAIEGKCHIEGTDLVCTPADGNAIRLAISEENKTIEYAGGLSYKRGIVSKPVEEPAQQNSEADVNAKGNTSKTATAKNNKPKNRKTVNSTPRKKKSQSTPNNPYSSKKRSPSMPEF